MPRVNLKKKDYMLQDFNAWVAGQLYIREMKQSDLGDLLGIPQQSVSQRLKGKVDWSLPEIIKIFERFETDQEQIGKLLIVNRGK